MTPAGTSNELDVQNGWEENTHTPGLPAGCIHECYAIKCASPEWSTITAYVPTTSAEIVILILVKAGFFSSFRSREKKRENATKQGKIQL